MIRAWFAVPASVAVLVACSSGADSLGPIPPDAPALAPGQTMTIDATVRFRELEGGCWLLVEPAGSRYLFDLPARFRLDGLRVRASVRGSSSTTFCGLGVTVDSIRVR